MARILVRHEGVLRRLANIDTANHDGSINLALVRSGCNLQGWHWDSTRSDFDAVEYGEPKPKTKRISIHTSGRINFHVTPNPGVNYIPCLLDLTEAVPLLAYVIPSAGALDLAEAIRPGDYVIELVGDGLEGALGFEFSVIPAGVVSSAGEVWRFIVEGRYGLTCRLCSGSSYSFPDGIPREAFHLIHPSSLLSEATISEEQAFIRFQQLMHSNQLRQALVSSPIPGEVHEQVIVEAVTAGRGIRGPNNQGVWEIVCNVPMRIRPKLEVRFAETRYRADMIDMKPADRRLEKVRVRFRVFDEQAQKWIKHPVEITSAFLDAEL